MVYLAIWIIVPSLWHLLRLAKPRCGCLVHRHHVAIRNPIVVIKFLPWVHKAGPKRCTSILYPTPTAHSPSIKQSTASFFQFCAFYGKPHRHTYEKYQSTGSLTSRVVPFACLTARKAEVIAGAGAAELTARRGLLSALLLLATAGACCSFAFSPPSLSLTFSVSNLNLTGLSPLLFAVDFFLSWGHYWLGLQQ